MNDPCDLTWDALSLGYPAGFDRCHSARSLLLAKATPVVLSLETGSFSLRNYLARVYVRYLNLPTEPSPHTTGTYWHLLAPT